MTDARPVAERSTLVGGGGRTWGPDDDVLEEAGDDEVDRAGGRVWELDGGIIDEARDDGTDM